MTSITDTANSSLLKSEQGFLARSRFMDFSPLSLSLFRIAFAAYILIYRFADRLPSYVMTFTDRGVVPRSLLPSLWWDPGAFSVLAWSDSIAFHFAFLMIELCAALAMLVGYKTRLSTALLFIISVSLYWRNPIASRSRLVEMIDVLLLWSCFLPLNYCLSVDAARNPLLKQRACPKMALIAIKVQIVLLYFIAGFSKLGGPLWLNGTALSSILADNLAGNFSVDHWLILHLPGLLYRGTYAVIAFQLLFPFLVYSPFYNNQTRTFALIGAIVFHLSIYFTMDIGPFPQLCLCCMLLLVPDIWWRTLFSRYPFFSCMAKQYVPGRSQQHGVKEYVSGALCAVILLFAVGSSFLQAPCPFFLACYGRYPFWVSGFSKAFLDASSVFQAKQEWNVFAFYGAPNQLYLSIEAHHNNSVSVTYMQDAENIHILRNLDKSGTPFIQIPRMYYLRRIALDSAWQAGKEPFALYICRELNAGLSPVERVNYIKMSFYILPVGAVWSPHALSFFSNMTGYYSCKK